MKVFKAGSRVGKSIITGPTEIENVATKRNKIKLVNGSTITVRDYPITDFKSLHNSYLILNASYAERYAGIELDLIRLLEDCFNGITDLTPNVAEVLIGE